MTQAGTECLRHGNQPRPERDRGAIKDGRMLSISALSSVTRYILSIEVFLIDVGDLHKHTRITRAPPSVTTFPVEHY